MYYTFLRISFFFLIGCATTLLAQTTTINIETTDFTLDQDANKVGRVWYPEPIDVRADFLLDLNVFLGCNDEVGADGLLLILNQKPILGLGGPPMGRPSLGLEIDTYYNPNLGDPDVDHLAILENGHFNHSKMSTKPIQLKKNIENCQYHQLVIEWKAEEQVLQVTLDELGNRFLYGYW